MKLFIYCMVEKSDQVLSRNVSPPLIWEQFWSCFRFLQFIPWNIEIWNLSKKYFKNERLDAYLRNLHNFEILWRISQVLFIKSTSYWSVLFFTFKNVFLFYNNLMRALFWILSIIWVVKNDSIIFLSQNRIFETL